MNKNELSRAIRKARGMYHDGSKRIAEYVYGGIHGTTGK